MLIISGQAWKNHMRNTYEIFSAWCSTLFAKQQLKTLQKQQLQMLLYLSALSLTKYNADVLLEVMEC